MRKHFLTLMLLSLVSLVGWAQINLSTAGNVVIELNRTQLDYTGAATAPVVTGLSVGNVDKTETLDDLTVTYYKKTGAETYEAIDAAAVRNAGDYALTLKGDGDPYTTDESAKVDFTINKGELSITLTNATKTYGDADPAVIEYTWDDMTQLRGTDDVNNVVLTLNFSATPRAAGENVNTTTGYAYNAITATTPNYDVTVHGSPVLFITKRPLIGAYTGTVEKVYGEDDPAFDKTKLSFTGWAASENTDDKKAAALTIANNATLSYTGSDANYSADGTTVLTGKALYPITITGVTSTNYQLTLPEIGMKIKQKDITTAGVTITATSAEATYNAAKQLIPASKYSVMYKGAAATFDVKYYSELARTTPVAEDNVKNVAMYYLTIVGKGNFAGVYNGVATATPNGFVWDIKQKDLWIYANDQTKVYDGSAWSADQITFEYSGLEGTDAVTTGAGATITDNSANVKAAGYTVVPTTASVVIKNGENVVTGNYNIQGLSSGLVKITARPLKLTAVQKTLDLGYTAAQLEAALEIGDDVVEAASGAGATLRGAVAGEVVTIKGAIAKSLDAALAEANGWNYANAGSYPNAINITWAAAMPDVLKNYTIEVVKGTFKVNGGEFTMIAKNVTVKYGEEIPAFEYLTSGNVALKAGATVTYKVFKGAEEIANPTEVGTYSIVIDEKTSEYLPANYTGINYAPGTLKIDPKSLTVVVANQTLSVGQGAAALHQGDKYATITGLKTGEKVKFQITGVAPAFNTAAVTAEPIPAAITVQLVAPGAGETGFSNKNYVINDANITKGALTVVPAATIVLNRPAKAAYTADPSLDDAADVITAAATEKYDAAGAAAYNAGLPGAKAAGDVKTPAVYTVVAEGEDLVDGDTYYTSADGDGEFVSDGSQTNVAANTYWTLTTAAVTYTEADAKAYNATLPGAVAANDAKKFTVAFGNFAMKAEKWYPIVLPFATSVKEVSETFGYAIVNILNPTNTDNSKIAFKLHMGDIEANTPFVVKVYDDMNMDEVAFDAKAIVKNLDPKVTDESGVKFIGSYSAKTDGFKDNEAYFSVAADKNQYYWGSSTNKTYMAPLAAYFQIPEGSAARIIEFEEADGTVTAIEVVKADANESNSVSSVKEGWYTLQGVKLESAPTQKGIYIFNGKKIAIQ